MIELILSPAVVHAENLMRISPNYFTFITARERITVMKDHMIFSDKNQLDPGTILMRGKTRHIVKWDESNKDTTIDYQIPFLPYTYIKPKKKGEMMGVYYPNDGTPHRDFGFCASLSPHMILAENNYPVLEGWLDRAPQKGLISGRLRHIPSGN